MRRAGSLVELSHHHEVSGIYFCPSLKWLQPKTKSDTKRQCPCKTVYLKPSTRKKQAIIIQHFKLLSGGVVCHMLLWTVGTAVWVKQWKLNYSVAWKAELRDPAWAVVRVLFLVFRQCLSYCIFMCQRMKRKTLSFLIYPKYFHPTHEDSLFMT